MKKKPSKIVDEKTWLAALLGQLILERDLLLKGYKYDGETLYPATKRLHPNPPVGQCHPRTAKAWRKDPPTSANDEMGGLVQTNLEICYGQLGNRLRELLTKSKVEANLAGFTFMDKAVEVHESCIESLRTGKGWDIEEHSKHLGLISDALENYKARLAMPTIAQAQKAKPGRKAIPGRREAAIEFMDDWDRKKYVIDFKKYCKEKGVSLMEGHRKRKLGYYHTKQIGK